MKAPVGSSRAAMSAVLFLLSIGVSRQALARLVELSNDVVITSTNQSNVNQKVSGAPRLVPDAQTAADRLRLTIVTTSAIQSNAEETFVVGLALSVVDPLTLQPFFVSTSGLPLTFPCDCGNKKGSRIVLTSDDFPGLDALQALPQRDLIFTVAGSIHKVNTASAAVTLSGPGREIFVDRVGDLDELDTLPGRDADDIPTRSMDVVRALTRIEAVSGSNRGVELDVAGRPGADVNRFVGFTHTFDLDPADGTIQDAVLRFRVTGDDHEFGSDFVLLESAVRNVATIGRLVPIVALCHLPGLSQVPGEGREFRINLRKVPVVFRYPSAQDPCPSRPVTLDLLPDLADGRLNVIIGDHGKVDFSDLLIFKR